MGFVFESIFDDHNFTDQNDSEDDEQFVVFLFPFNVFHEI